MDTKNRDLGNGERRGGGAVRMPRGTEPTVDRPRHERAAHETKPAFKTSEFFALLAAAAGIIIASASIGGDGGLRDFFTSDKAWLLLTVLAVGYMLSRGLAKAAISHGRGETKPSFKTTELVVYVLSVLGVLVTAAATSSDNGVADAFNADRAWLYVAILSAGYMLSRGLSKLGDRHVEDDSPNGHRPLGEKLNRAVEELKS
jgi:hypothetical protein